MCCLFFFLSFFSPSPITFRTQRGLNREKLGAGSLGFRVWLVSGNLIQTWGDRCLHGSPSQNMPGDTANPYHFPRPAQGARRSAKSLPLCISRLPDGRTPRAAITARRGADEAALVRRPSASPAPRPHFTSYVGSQAHGAVACKACAQDTEPKPASADRPSQGAKGVLRAPIPGGYRAGAAAVRKHVRILSTQADAEHAQSCVRSLQEVPRPVLTAAGGGRRKSAREVATEFAQTCGGGVLEPGGRAWGIGNPGHILRLSQCVGFSRHWTGVLKTFAIIRYLRSYLKISCPDRYLQGQVHLSCKMPVAGTEIKC